MQAYEMTIKELQAALREKKISASEAMQGYQGRVADVDPLVQGYISLNPQTAEKQAVRAQQRLDDRTAQPLTGIPMAIKDNLCTKGIETTCASKMLENFVPPYTATAVEKLFNQDAVMLGKANMDEFAMGSSTETSYFFETKNPHDLNRVPGGSSGGSAAIVASGMAAFALGTDTGGSIRQPASLCGVVGFKPTYGMVSRYGLIAFASSLDQIGVFSHTVEDCAVVMDAIAGPDAKDSTSMQQAAPKFESSLTGDVKGVKIGIPQEYFGQGVTQQVREAVQKAARDLESLGAIVEPCSLPLTQYGLPTYYLLACAEASSNLARYDGVRYGFRAEEAESFEDMLIRTRTEGFGDEVKRRIMLGAFVLSAGYYDAYYKKALASRALIKRDFRKAFETYDLLLTPTSPNVAWEMGEVTDPLAMYAADVCTVAVNIAGLPGLSVPCGKDEDGMPIGLQLIGAHYQDAKVLNAGHAYQQNFGQSMIRPVCQKGGAK